MGWEAVKNLLAVVAACMIFYQIGKWIYRPRPAPEWFRLLVSKGQHQSIEENDQATIYVTSVMPYLGERDRYLLAALVQEMAKRNTGGRS